MRCGDYEQDLVWAITSEQEERIKRITADAEEAAEPLAHKPTFLEAIAWLNCHQPFVGHDSHQAETDRKFNFSAIEHEN